MDNKQQVEGKFEQAKGTVKENVGRAIDDPQMENEGKNDQLKGNVREGIGDVRERRGSSRGCREDRRGLDAPPGAACPRPLSRVAQAARLLHVHDPRRGHGSAARAHHQRQVVEERQQRRQRGGDVGPTGGAEHRLGALAAIADEPERGRVGKQRLLAPNSTGSVTNVNTTAAAKKIRPTTARPKRFMNTPMITSHGARVEPMLATGTINWRSAMAGSRCWCWTAWPTSWAITATAATDGPAPAGVLEAEHRSTRVVVARLTRLRDRRADAQRARARVVVVGQVAGRRLDANLVEALAVEQVAGEIEGGSIRMPKSTLSHLAYVDLTRHAAHTVRAMPGSRTSRM